MMATSNKSLYEACAIGDGGEIDVNSLICISQHFQFLQAQNVTRQSNLNQWLMVLTGSMIFFMQAGFAMVCAGCVRKKNLQNTMLKVKQRSSSFSVEVLVTTQRLIHCSFSPCFTCYTYHQNILDVSFASFIFYLVGFGIAFGGEADYEGFSFVGKGHYLGNYGKDFNFGFWFMQFCFCATCTFKREMAAMFLACLLLLLIMFPGKQALLLLQGQLRSDRRCEPTSSTALC